MNAENIKDAFLNDFHFLKDLGYDQIEIYQNSTYDLGITLNNKALDQKFSFAYYSKAPIKTDYTNNEYAFFFALFKKGEHIDFSRLLKKDIRFSKYSLYQYFVLPCEISPEHFLISISQVLNLEYSNLLTGNHWVEIDYDPRDDY